MRHCDGHYRKCGMGFRNRGWPKAQAQLLRAPPHRREGQPASSSDPPSVRRFPRRSVCSTKPAPAGGQPFTVGDCRVRQIRSRDGNCSSCRFYARFYALGKNSGPFGTRWVHDKTARHRRKTGVCPHGGELGEKWVQEPESPCKRDALTAAPSAQTQAGTMEQHAAGASANLGSRGVVDDLGVGA
jgi:hypothetical protein